MYPQCTPGNTTTPSDDFRLTGGRSKANYNIRPHYIARLSGEDPEEEKTTSKAPLHPKVEEKGLKMSGISTSESSRGKIKQDEKYLDIPGKKRKV